MKKFLLALLVLLFIGGVYLKEGKQPQPLPANMQSAEMLKPGPYQVRKQKLTLTDQGRSVAANGDYEGAKQRSFKVLVWTPKTRPDTPQPLLIYSHGFMSSGRGGSYLGEHLASHGYTVAAPTFPLTHLTAPGGPNIGDVINQPGDVSFIVDTLLAGNADPQSDFYQRIDSARIAAAGLSLGGLTSELVAYHPQTGDRRIAAAISIAGPADMLSERFFAHRAIPFMMVATPQDAMVAYDANAANILDKVPGAVLVTMDNASHAGFASTAKWLRWMDNPDSLGCDYLMKNIEDVDEDDWLDSIGTAEMGVVPADVSATCTMDPMPKTMNPIRQHQLNTLAVSSFLWCHFEPDSSVAQESCDFLNTRFAQEIPEVRVDS